MELGRDDGRKVVLEQTTSGRIHMVQFAVNFCIMLLFI